MRDEHEGYRGGGSGEQTRQQGQYGGHGEEYRSGYGPWRWRHQGSREQYGYGGWPHGSQRYPEASQGWGPYGTGGYARQSEMYGSMRGQYAGRGPKGYQRSDARIREDVCERLSQNGEIDATEVEVTVLNGEVTLSGVVQSRWVKRMAEDEIESVSGVKQLHNQLRVSDGTVAPAAGQTWGQERSKAA